MLASEFEKLAKLIKLAAHPALTQNSDLCLRKIQLDTLVFEKAAQAAAASRLGEELLPILLRSTAYAAPPLLGAAYLLNRVTEKIEEQKKDLIKKTLLGAAGVALAGIGLQQLLSSSKSTPLPPAIPAPIKKTSALADKAAVYRKLATIGAVDALLSMCKPTEKIAAARAINRSYGVYILSKLLEE